ncbi:MAG: cytochrome P450 [Pseudomonadota bacterium]
MFVPPRPRSLPAVAALIRSAAMRDGDLLSLLPDFAYRDPVRFIGVSRRQILIVNDPDLVKQVMVTDADIFPKSDLMVGALEPLVGNSLFVSSGPVWQRQRRMVDPAFSQLRIDRAFKAMRGAVDDYETSLEAKAARGEPVSLDLAMSHLTADIICRTVFSTSLESSIAREVFEDFLVFERAVAHVEIRRLIMGKAWTEIPQPPDVLAACQRIRGHIGTLLDPHLEEGGNGYDDIASVISETADPGDGERFTREELIDQLGVFFLAGHETTASALTWCFYILSQAPEHLARLRAEIEAVSGGGPLMLQHVKAMPFARAVFKEALRLYPPITFIPRVALEATRIGPYKIRKGAMVMIAPWSIHRHHALWDHPDVFDPDRFAPGSDRTRRPGTYLPFGYGSRVCIGAGFAAVESALILARLARRFDFAVEDPAAVRPVARLTTRPKEQITVRVFDRGLPEGAIAPVTPSGHEERLSAHAGRVSEPLAS